MYSGWYWPGRNQVPWTRRTLAAYTVASVVLGGVGVATIIDGYAVVGGAAVLICAVLGCSAFQHWQRWVAEEKIEESSKARTHSSR
jgi:hypothetical protein